MSLRISSVDGYAWKFKYGNLIKYDGEILLIIGFIYGPGPSTYSDSYMVEYLAPGLQTSIKRNLIDRKATIALSHLLNKL